jgi:hypothetical protein
VGVAVAGAEVVVRGAVGADAAALNLRLRAHLAVEAKTKRTLRNCTM